MEVFRVERTRDYTVMSNHHLKNRDLSLKAKGLLSMMLSLSDDGDYTTRGLAPICRESVDAIGKALKELESAGYMERRQIRGKDGRITDTEYAIYEQPRKSPGMPFPDTDSPDIAGENMSAEAVKSRLLKLDDSHIEYVLECLDKNTTDIRNIRSYILTVLYQAPTTISSYYSTLVNHDMHGSDPPGH